MKRLMTTALAGTLVLLMSACAQPVITDNSNAPTMTAESEASGLVLGTEGVEPETTVQPRNQSPGFNAAAAGQRMSSLDARKMVTDRFGGFIQKIEYTYDSRRPMYKGEALKKGQKLVFEINAADGGWAKYDVSNDNNYDTYEQALPDMLTMNEAVASVIEKSGNATTFVQKIELNWDDRNPYYQGEAFYEGTKISFELYAHTGEYGKFDVDRGDDTFIEQYADVARDGTSADLGRPVTTQPIVIEEPTTQAVTTQPVTTPPTTPATTQTTTTTTERPTTATTQAAITRDEAIEIALAKVPGATRDHIVEIDLDDDNEWEFEIKYDGYEYEVEVHRVTGEVTDFEKEREYKPQTTAPTTQAPQTTVATTRAQISRDRAIEIALAKVPGATVDHIREIDLDDDDEWEFEIKYDGYEYDIEVHRYTGDVIEFEKELDDDYRAPVQTTQAPQTTVATTRSQISRDRAIEIALAKVPGATVNHIHEIDLDDDDEWEFEIKYDGYEYDIEINRYTGVVTEFEKEWDDDYKAPTTQAPTQDISRDRAIEIALSKAPGATRNHIEDVEFDDGKWEIEIEVGDTEYEIEISRTGTVLDVEVDYDD